jgi:hypothetical protein
VASLVAAAMATLLSAAPARAAGPSITLTDPAPGTTVVAGSSFRVGWRERAGATSVPITKRTISECVAASKIRDRQLFS